VRLCRAGSRDCVEPVRRVGDALARLELDVPAPGVWSVSVWREDAAGNADERLASVPVTLRYDPEPPQLGFEHSPLSDPTLVSVLVSDRVSGLAGGEIELRRQGTASWQTLETHVQGSRLVTRLDDARLPAGVVDLLRRGQLAGEASVELVQEYLNVLLRRSVADAAGRARDVAAICASVHAFEHRDLELALSLVEGEPPLGARDAVHAATALNRGIGVILSADRHLDGIDGLRRLDPLDREAVASL